MSGADEILRKFLRAAEMFPPETADAARVYEPIVKEARRVLAERDAAERERRGVDDDAFDLADTDLELSVA